MKLEEFVEQLEWKCFIVKQDGRYYAELEHYSPLGEDVIDVIWFDEQTVESFIEGLEECRNNTDEKYQEDAELYIKERPRGTENFSIRELIDDADAKVEQFNDFVDETKKLYNEVNGIDDGTQTYYVRFHVDTAIDIKVNAKSIGEAKELAEADLIELNDYNKLEWIDSEYTHTEDANGNIID